MATLTLTVLGEDRPGLVSELSAPINAHGANWQHSQLARLAGKFAGIVMVSVADQHLDALTADLEALSTDDLQVLFERTDARAGRQTHRLHLNLLGADHPGIVAEISASLAAMNVNIEELRTDVRDAPMSGGTLFEAHAVLDAPASTSTEVLRSKLEGLANELMVEIRLADD
jgi:glycine cleavage system regulatory protein